MEHAPPPKIWINEFQKQKKHVIIYGFKAINMEQAPDQEDIIQNQNHQLINPNPSKDAAKIANNFNNAVNLITNTRELNIPVFQYQKINIEPNQSINQSNISRSWRMLYSYFN